MVSVYSSTSHSGLSDQFDSLSPFEHSTVDALQPGLLDHPLADEYQHTPLAGNGRIRLLTLRKSSDRSSQSPRKKDIYFDFEQFDLRHDCPQYRALSYVWGSTNSFVNVPMANGKSLPITQNLFEALCYAINASKLSLHTWLWVDQICIDQSSIEERSQQVQDMGKIYRSSTEVVVWLGSSASSLKHIHDLLPESPDVQQCYRKKPPGGVSELFEPLLDIDFKGWNNDLQRMQALEDLFRRPWFSRAWVVQEAVLARQDTVLIGTHQTTILQLFALVSAFVGCCRMAIVESSPKELKEPKDVRIGQIYVMARMTRRRLAGMLRHRRGGYSLMDSLNNLGGHFECTVSKDLIYAFCGLCDDARRLIKVNYSLPLGEIFQQTARSFLVSEKSLRLFGHCDRRQYSDTPTVQNRLDRQALEDLPSWVPNWSLKYATHPVDTTLTGSPLGYNACGDYTDHGCQSKSNRAGYEARGKIITEVCSVQSGYIRPRPTNALKPAKNFDLDKLAVEINLPRCSDLSSQRERLVALFVGRGSRDHGIQTEDFGPLVRRFECAYEQSQGISDDRLHQEENLALRETLQELYEYSLTGVMFRRLIQTTDKKLGLAPRTTKPQDLIAILHGSTVPVVLRESAATPGHYRLIGQCYVENVMMGEAVTWEEDEADEFSIV